jgi:hypothetical protein
MVMDHPVDMQVFHTDNPMGINDLAALLMGKVLPSPGDTLMHTGHGFAVLPAFRRAFGKFGVLSLHSNHTWYMLKY